MAPASGASNIVPPVVSGSGEHTATQGTSSDGAAPASTCSLDEVPSVASASATAVVQAPMQPKFRHSYYQATGYVVVTIFAKGVAKEDIDVDFGEQLLSVVIRTGDEHPCALKIRLFGKIIVEQCKVTLSKTKIEIYLAKAEHIHWTKLEYSPEKFAQRIEGPKAQYPSSSKKGAKDWDKLESQAKKEEKEEKLEGDAALNKLFREIYSNADEDTRRAMNKSYVESNGTVLSTNWKEVGSKKVVASPPSGMEAKRWDS